MLPPIKPARGYLPRIFLMLGVYIFLNTSAFSQKGDTLTLVYKTVIAGEQYKKNALHQWLWGKHYRRDWATQVKVSTINLDTVNGELIAYEKGGGRQSKTLRLRNAAGKEYVLRSIDKSFGKALPDIYRGTFLEDIVDDQVSIAQPYSALTIPGMAEAAGIYHTNPQIVYVPSQKALGEFDKDFGNGLYLFEQRPDENWEEAVNFGNAKKIISTEKMLEKILDDNDKRVDQLGFVRARLFDMFIGDWGRHEDQWRWAAFEDGDKTLYKPIPRDRDQAFTKFDGALLSKVISAAGIDHAESFGPGIKNVATYNYPARYLDRQLANEPTKEQWISIARALQVALTDAVIEESVHQLPPEVFVLSGQELINNLKSRREKLVDFATGYYTFLAREVEITGTSKSELFRIRSISSTETEIAVYDLNKEGQPKKQPFYSRKFPDHETKEIRLYGIGGNDQYDINTTAGNTIRVRIIGGNGNDSYTSTNGGTGQIHIYDDRHNDFTHLNGTRKHLSNDTLIHEYNYKGFNYDKKGLGFILSYNSEDHIHVGLKYKIEKQQWRKYPFGQRHEWAARYSINEKAFSFGYSGIFKEAVGKWDLLLNANYDFVRWNNYYGIGNETIQQTTNRDFHRVRTKEFYAGLGIDRTFARYHHVRLTGFYQTIEILNDPGRFLTKQNPPSTTFKMNQFGGGKLGYYYQKLDDEVVPTKGLRFGTDISFMQNLGHSDSAVVNYSAALNIYLPLAKWLVLALKTGGATLSGNPAFYQLNKLGGIHTLRGFRKNRFYGETSFYNQAELQFLCNVKSYLYNGKIGFIGLYDIGRVWQPGESSDTWHAAYGGGLMLAPFNKVSITVYYAVSGKESALTFKVLKGL